MMGDESTSGRIVFCVDVVIINGAVEMWNVRFILKIALFQRIYVSNEQRAQFSKTGGPPQPTASKNLKDMKGIIVQGRAVRGGRRRLKPQTFEDGG